MRVGAWVAWIGCWVMRGFRRCRHICVSQTSRCGHRRESRARKGCASTKLGCPRVPSPRSLHFTDWSLSCPAGGGGCGRSEERRVGKEGVRTCRSRVSQMHEKKKSKQNKQR